VVAFRADLRRILQQSGRIIVAATMGGMLSPNLKVVDQERLSPTRLRLAEVIEALNRASADVEAASAPATRLREVIAEHDRGRRVLVECEVSDRTALGEAIAEGEAITADPSGATIAAQAAVDERQCAGGR
jgi:hypothetical protein